LEESNTVCPGCGERMILSDDGYDEYCPTCGVYEEVED